MSLYEHIFIARQDVSSSQVDSMIDGFSQIIEQHGGKVTKKEYWGLKTMAYRIKKNRKGHYVLLNLDASSEAVLEMERNQRLHEDVLRILTLRADQLEEGPSVMMQGRREREGNRRGRYERDGEGRGPRSDDGAPRPAAAPAAAAAVPAEAAKAPAEAAKAPAEAAKAPAEAAKAPAEAAAAPAEAAAAAPAAAENKEDQA